MRDSALRRREYQPHKIAEQQQLPWNDGRVPQHAAEDQPTLDQRGGRVGQRLEVDLMSRWITLCNQAQPFAEANPFAGRRVSIRGELLQRGAQKFLAVSQRDIRPID